MRVGRLAQRCLCRQRPQTSHPMGLLSRGEVRAAVPLPAILVGFGTGGPFLAVADGLQPVAGNPELHQKILGGGGSAVAQSKVVLGRAAFVAVALDGDAGSPKLLQDGLYGISVLRQRGARI